MAGETPEQIRERIHQEELAKGSDPRVAEGRAKAAELRARQGLPIDPKEAAKAKLEREGGGAPAAPDVTAEAAAESPGQAPAEAAAEAPAAPLAEAPAEPATPPAGPQTAPAAPRAEMPAALAVGESPRVAAAIAPAQPRVLVPELEPEIGDIVVDDEVLKEIAGLRLREARVPWWLAAAMVMILALSAFYVIVFSGAGPGEGAGCEVRADRSAVCFLE